MFIIAIIAGKIARKPKNATPPPMIGMLSALFSAQARRTICFQPCQGIWVGLSAVMPGSSCSLRAPPGPWPPPPARPPGGALARLRVRAAGLRGPRGRPPGCLLLDPLADAVDGAVAV